MHLSIDTLLSFIGGITAGLLTALYFKRRRDRRTE
jgi:hypothetical protein